MPLKCARTPGVFRCFFTADGTVHKVVQKNKLRRADDQRTNGDELIQVGHGVGDEIVLLVGVIAPWYAKEANVMHGEIDQIRTNKSDPKMYCAKPVVQHSSGDRREPVIEPSKQSQNRGNSHNHVEMAYHKISIRQRYIYGYIAQEKSG